MVKAVYKEKAFEKSSHLLCCGGCWHTQKDFDRWVKIAGGRGVTALSTENPPQPRKGEID